MILKALNSHSGVPSIFLATNNKTGRKSKKLQKQLTNLYRLAGDSRGGCTKTGPDMCKDPGVETFEEVKAMPMRPWKFKRGDMRKELRGQDSGLGLCLDSNGNC